MPAGRTKKVKGTSENSLTKNSISREHEEVGGAIIDSEVITTKNDEEVSMKETKMLKEAFGAGSPQRKKPSRRKKRRPGFFVCLKTFSFPRLK